MPGGEGATTESTLGGSERRSPRHPPPVTRRDDSFTRSESTSGGASAAPGVALGACRRTRVRAPALPAPSVPGGGSEGAAEAPFDGLSMSGIEKLAFGLFLAGTVLFFVWVAVLTLKK